jgi:hypothetical protein
VTVGARLRLGRVLLEAAGVDLRLSQHGGIRRQRCTGAALGVARAAEVVVELGGMGGEGVRCAALPVDVLGQSSQLVGVGAQVAGAALHSRATASIASGSPGAGSKPRAGNE